ncbi:MAG TPA: hypothetical protein VF796_15630, partial [Humisphaera sp.]
ARADRAAAAGNDVRAAILAAQATRGDRTGLWFVPGAADRPFDRFVGRLAKALELGEDAADRWRAALRPLLGPASLGWWNAERRLLYDLQKVCADAEAEVYNTNVVEWVLELCRRPLHRKLPLQRPALVARHLKSAEHRLTGCRLPAEARHALEHLFHDAVHRADHALRAAVTPRAAAAFDAVGLVPRNAVERAARDKVADEMADAVLRDGYLTFGGLRDTISRNALRCEDLRNPLEWAGYDQLLRLDRQLGDHLDGVYRRGEIYRYGFQKFSSWLFATRPARFVTRLAVMPVVGAVVLVAGFQFTILHLLHAIVGWAPHVFPEHHEDFDGWEDLPKFYPTIGMALFLVLVINWPAFRRASGRVAKWLFRQVGFVVSELPERLIRNPVVRWLTTNRRARLAGRWVLKPLVFASVAYWLLPHKSPIYVEVLVFVVVFLIVNVVVNSPPGRAVEEAVLYSLRVGWVRYTADTLAGAFRAVMRFFERMVETVDRALYAVDEWLRFRSGQKRGSLLGKAVLGVFWFYIAYVFRFALNLLVEPQVNPIKHFPVVTVSHKLLLPLALPPHHAAGSASVPSPFGGILQQAFAMPVHQANTWALSIIWLIPGIFGFLAWELKENWKLYRANLPRSLRPVHFGSHGESVAQLLRPGFHSGTLPKAYAKLRKAHRLSGGAGGAAEEGMEFPLAVHKPLEAIHHVEEGVRHFVERSFLSLLNRHPAFAGTPVELAGLRLGPTRIVVDLASPAAGPTPLRVSFEQVAGWIVAGTVDAGWTADLAGIRAAVFAAALRGFYKQAAVDVVREDVDRALAGRGVRWELRHKQLVVRPTDPAAAAPAVYWLHEREMTPRTPDGEPAANLPVLADADVLFRVAEIPWDAWVALWGTADDGPANAQVEATARARATEPVHA